MTSQRRRGDRRNLQCSGTSLEKPLMGMMLPLAIRVVKKRQVEVGS